jgi:hypothetical protein
MRVVPRHDEVTPRGLARAEGVSVLLAGWSRWTRRAWRAWPSLAVILTALATAPAITWAQQISGALGVSLVVLPPVSTQPVDVMSFRVDQDGIARLETTAPIAGSMSAIVMSTVSSSASGFVPQARAPALVNATCRPEWLEATIRPHYSRAPQLCHEVDLGPASVRSQSRDVSVRISYLVVPGT